MGGTSVTPDERNVCTNFVLCLFSFSSYRSQYETDGRTADGRTNGGTGKTRDAAY